MIALLTYFLLFGKTNMDSMKTPYTKQCNTTQQNATQCNNTIRYNVVNAVPFCRTPFRPLTYYVLFNYFFQNSCIVHLEQYKNLIYKSLACLANEMRQIIAKNDNISNTLGIGSMHLPQTCKQFERKQGRKE